MIRNLSKTFLRLTNTSIHGFASSSGYHFYFGVQNLPHPEKVAKGGEDALYADENLLVVADGVGGWIELGIDSGKYSRELCKHIGNLWKENKNAYRKKPKGLIIGGAKLTKSEGSSTCCILNIENEENVLYTSLIGDSGYRLIRQTNNALETIFISEEHTRDFNFPYQIGSEGDPPEIAVEAKHEVKENDIIVLGTDGVFDNLFEDQMTDFLKSYVQKDGSISNIDEVTKKFGKYVYDYSLSPKHVSPFALRANKRGFYYLGGKSDDITLILAQIKRRAK